MYIIYITLYICIYVKNVYISGYSYSGNIGSKIGI